MEESKQDYIDKSGQFKELFYSFVRCMTKAIDQRTPYNGTHTRNMVRIGGRFLEFLNQKASAAGRKLPFDAREQEELLMSVWLHDLGKLVTPLTIMNKETRLRPEEELVLHQRMEMIRMSGRIDCVEGRISPGDLEWLADTTRELEIMIHRISRWGDVDSQSLRKLYDMQQLSYQDGDGRKLPWLTRQEYEALSVRRGNLTDQERRIMEEHVVYTDRLLSEIQFPQDFSHVRAWATAHHELLDGSGYPRGLKGDEIPYQVRIITILDIFDALVADDRPYKPGIPVDKALGILEHMARKGKLDRQLTELFTESRCWEWMEG